MSGIGGGKHLLAVSFSHFGPNADFEIDIVVIGHSDDGVSTSCTGFAKQAPGLRLEVELIRMCDD
jgi:hypothetical protein